MDKSKQSDQNVSKFYIMRRVYLSNRRKPAQKDTVKTSIVKTSHMLNNKKCCLIIKCCAYANLWDSPLGPQSTSPSGSSDAQEGGGVRPRTASMDKQALQVLMPSFSRGHARHGGVRGNANPSIRTSNITINYYY